MELVTCVAPINIAVIKYWGKSNEDLNIPLNSSLSITIDPSDLCTTSTICVSDRFSKDQMWLNGNEQSIRNSQRTIRVLSEARKSEKNRDGETKMCHVASINNFPTAAGLASSASGYACLAKCLSEVYDYSGNLSVLARLGSGSACRSINGGFVKWEKGSCPTGNDSKAVQIASPDHWPELRILILIVSNKEKSVGSTEAMRRSVKTSELLQYRAEECVPKRLNMMENAIYHRNFEQFAINTMADSNQFHAICQDTYPPICPPYMNDVSHHIVQLISLYNANSIKAAYTFDAGPNAVIFTLQDNMEELLATIMKYFPHDHEFHDKSYINISLDETKRISSKSKEFEEFKPYSNGLERVILTRPGCGAYRSSDASPLLDSNGDMI